MLADRLLASARVDLTENRIYTLSPGTRQVLEGLQEQNPQEIAEKILSYAICASEGRIRDDMTVFVLCLWENT